MSFVVFIYLILVTCSSYSYSSRYLNAYYDYLFNENSSDEMNLEHSDRHKNKAHVDKELAAKFAPYLIYDKKCKEFPMDPEIFFNYEIKRDYSEQMQNHVLDTSTNPTFYRIYDCSHTHIVIDYWFFYGYQGECDNLLPKFIRKKYDKVSSIHDGDWEHIMVDLKVTIKPGKDEYTINKVVFNAHGDAWTKSLGNFEIKGEGKDDQTHPVVYPGLIMKGSYHNKHKTLAFPCLFWDDRRMGDGKTLKTQKNLKSLEECMDGWCKYYRSDISPKYSWGPLGKSGINTNPLSKVDANRLKARCNVPKCSGDACDDKWQTKFDKYGGRFRSGLKGVQGVFHKGIKKVGEFFR